MRVIKRKEYVLEDGWYQGIIKRVDEVEGKYGNSIRIEVELYTEPKTSRFLFLPTQFTLQNKTGRFLKVMGFNLDEDEIEIDKCIGKELSVYITNVKIGTRTVARITDFAPIQTEETVEKAVEKVKKVFKNAKVDR